jgi:Fur family zinc uptake transcriptional regulator
MSETHASCGVQDTDLALDEADRLCRSRGERLTPLRRHVLRLLIEARRPAKAYDLLEKLDGEGAAKPPTIYRALEFLQDMQLAHKIESLNAYVACGHRDHAHSAVFLICQSCGQTSELHTERVPDVLREDAAAVGFTVRHAVIEVRGLCARCGKETRA